MKRFIIFGAVILLVLSAVFVYLRPQATKSESDSKAGPIKRTPKSDLDKTAIFAGGCFWSLESYFEKIPAGIVDVVSGYSGGTTEDATYEDYVEGGHREAVLVTYNPSLISYAELVEYYFRHIDPTDPRGSFFDRGEGYTSAIYYENEEERKIAAELIGIIEKEKIFRKPIVTELLERAPFWAAEEEHQDYAYNNPERYTAYRIGSGRDAFLEKTWQGREKPLLE